MKTITLSLILLISGLSYAGTAYFKYERTTGMTKQCVYDYLGSKYTITISNIKLCPLSIKV